MSMNMCYDIVYNSNKAHAHIMDIIQPVNIVVSVCINWQNIRITREEVSENTYS